MLELFASCARGLEPAVSLELEAISRASGRREASGVQGLEVVPGGVAFSGDIRLAYECVLWLRSASRLLLLLRRFPLADEAQLYAEVSALDWTEILRPKATLAVDCAGQHPALSHTRFAALRVKDAIVDQLRGAWGGERPSVDTANPDLRLNLHLSPEQGTLSVDLGGGPLHRRGYRSGSAPAPLRENLAAGLLILAGWAERLEAARERGGEAFFCDPLCGSGTLALEAALMAADCAPGLLRGSELGSPGYMGHRAELFTELARRATQRDRRREPPSPATIIASDIDGRMVTLGRRAAVQAGLSSWVHFSVADVTETAEEPAIAPEGLLVTNPPYGERLGEHFALERLYLGLGETLRRRFGGWSAHILSGNRELTSALGLRAEGRVPLKNGPIDCRLLSYPLRAKEPGGASASKKKKAQPQGPLGGVRRLLRDAQSAEMLANRLKKNERKLKAWVKREEVMAYRVYDADLPEYASSIDRYGDALLIHEYAAPSSVDPRRAEARLHDTLVVAAEVLGVEPEAVHLKVRQRQRGSSQYQREERSDERFQIVENGLRFWVNLRDFLDSGVFLDHRPMRQRLRQEAAGKRFLNLFCYTATASVFAAAGGATGTTSVDLSKTYLDWAMDNLGANGFPRGARHALVHSDVLRWLESAARQPKSRYELIFCDPPTFSTSKRMEEAFEVQRDHVDLVAKAAALLAPQGVLYFSCNRRGFHLDEEALVSQGLSVESLGESTIPPDFRRGRPPHRAFRVTRGGRQKGAVQR